MELCDIEDTDWVSQVQASWKPQVIDDLTIRFPWHDPDETKTKMELVLEGGAAFGTGDHPTTRLCCRWLARNINANKDMNVLDYGCGSAILGLAALRYGATSADGTDIDLDALISASRNCINNNLSMNLYLADDSELDEVQSIVMNQLRGSNSNVNFLTVAEIENKKYDLVVANILAPILISLAPQLAKHTKPGGKIALSGLVIQQKEVLIKRYSEFFDDVILEESEDDWILITG
jgi:ribosomal protein L11 methyltransferase